MFVCLFARDVLKFAIFAECVAMGSRLSLEQVWRLELHSPSTVRATASVHNGSQQALAKYDPDDVYWIRSIFSHSMLLLRFATCVEAALAFCVAGAMLRSASILARCVSWQARRFALVHFANAWQGQRDEGGAFDEMQRQGCANLTQHEKSWRGQHIL